MDSLQRLIEPFESISPERASSVLLEDFAVNVLALERLDSERDDSFHVTATTGHFVLKVAHPDDDPAVIDLQLAAMAHVASADPGVPIQHVVLSVRGEQTVMIDGRAGRLLTWLPGDLARAHQPTSAERQAMGAMLGRLNLALASFEHPASRRELAWDALQLPAIEHFATDRGDLELIAKFASTMAPALGRIPRQVIHNDFHPGNLLVDPEDPVYVVGILDFGDVVYSARVCDLAVALAYLRPNERQSFVDGFASMVSVDGDEYELLDDLVEARQILRTVIGAHLDRKGA